MNAIKQQAKFFKVKIERVFIGGPQKSTFYLAATSKKAAERSVVTSHGPCKVLEVSRIYV